jgi:hypothetical protein
MILDQLSLTRQASPEKKKAASRRPNQNSQGVQLPSLLARFHEINSPIVELVLETGCL